MDKMEDYEVNDVISNLSYLDRNDWERSRLNAYVVAQVNSRKQLKPTDIIKFSWDTEEGIRQDTSISNEDIERLKKKSEQINKQLKNNLNVK